MPAVKRLGRPRETELRTVLDAVFDIARTGCSWRMLKDFPSFTSNRPEREPNARLDHISELLPALSEARWHDRHGDDEVAGRLLRSHTVSCPSCLMATTSGSTSALAQLADGIVRKLCKMHGRVEPFDILRRDPAHVFGKGERARLEIIVKPAVSVEARQTRQPA